MTNNEIKFREELIELLQRHKVRLSISRVYYPGDSEDPTFDVPPDKPGTYSTGITVDDIAEATGGWVN